MRFHGNKIQVTVQLDPLVAEALKRCAADQERSVSYVVAKLIEAHLQGKEGKMAHGP